MFEIYSHENYNPEADMVYICTCNSKNNADYIVKALKYFEGGGKQRSVGLYDYYIKKV